MQVTFQVTRRVALATAWMAVALVSSCSLVPSSAPKPSAPPASAPVAPTSSMTRQQIIETGRPLTVRLEVTTCGGYASGSGFLVGRNLVVTVAHVVHGAQTIAAQGLSGVSNATVIGMDEDRQVALLRLDDDLTNGPTLDFATQIPVAGDDVVVISYPRGRPQTPAAGAISALGLDEDVDGKRLTDLIQFDADTSPGSSGGPLIDRDGHVVGLTEGAYDDAAGLDYAISAHTARALVEAWTKAPATINPPQCKSQPHSAVTVESSHPDAPGIAFFMRQYFDGLNRGDRIYGKTTYESGYESAFDVLTGRLLEELGPYRTFRGQRIGVTHRKVVVSHIKRLSTVEDSVELTFRRTLPDRKTGKNTCLAYHYRYTVRLVTGVWTLDDRTALSNNRKPC